MSRTSTTSGTGVAHPFSPRSPLRRVGGEPAMILGGPRALLLQIAHPVVASGVAEHSDFREAPVTRLWRTMDAVMMLVFGTDEQARGALAMARTAHDRVHGGLVDPSPFGARGTPYSAHDRAAQAWVLCSLADTTELVFERFLRPFHPGEAEAVWQDWRCLGRVFGIPERLLPGTRAELRAHVHEMIEGDTLQVTPVTRELADHVLFPRLPLVPRSTWRPLLGFTASLLPDRLREAYDLPWGPRERADARRVDALNRLAWRLTPRARRRLPYAYVAARRLATPPPLRPDLRRAA